MFVRMAQGLGHCGNWEFSRGGRGEEAKKQPLVNLGHWWVLASDRLGLGSHTLPFTAGLEIPPSPHCILETDEACGRSGKEEVEIVAGEGARGTCLSITACKDAQNLTKAFT